MSRTSSSAVQGILRVGSQGGDYDDENSPSLDPYIASATVIVDRVATCATAKGKTLTSTELELIERWLAAHFYCMSDVTYQSRSTAGASASFTGQTGMYLEGTRYGQMAVSLDYSGCLLAIATGAQRKTAGFVWGGQRPSEQTNYSERD